MIIVNEAALVIQTIASYDVPVELIINSQFPSEIGLRDRFDRDLHNNVGYRGIFRYSRFHHIENLNIAIPTIYNLI